MISPTPVQRIASIDFIRGSVMILMAIDHVRVYSGLPAGGPEAGIFFTRWITHFCAPAFVFLAGTSSYFFGLKHGGLSRNLVVRGLWLILLELTVLRFAWTFNFEFANYEMAGVIWVIGWCMILLAGLVKMPLGVVGALGVAVIFLHNGLDAWMTASIESLNDDPRSGLWKILYVGFFAGPVSFGNDGPNLFVLYSIVPWIGVMAAGYAFAGILNLPPDRRDRWCLSIGLTAVALFILLRGFNLYGDPRPWSSDGRLPAMFSFLNTSKYPASLSFLLMTLGPTIALIPLLERMKSHAQSWIAVFGRVPFFYYILHIPIIHLSAIVVSWIRTGTVDPWLFANHPMGNPPPPEGYVWTLPMLYLVFVVVVGLLYFPSRWFVGIKARRSDWWLRYL